MSCCIWCLLSRVIKGPSYPYLLGLGLPGGSLRVGGELLARRLQLPHARRVLIPQLPHLPSLRVARPQVRLSACILIRPGLG